MLTGTALMEFTHFLRNLALKLVLSFLAVSYPSVINMCFYMKTWSFLEKYSVLSYLSTGFLKSEKNEYWFLI